MANVCQFCSSMPALPRPARDAVVIALLAMLILALAGCGSGRLSSREAAQKLGGYLSPRYRVQCHPASGPFWDYACTVTPPPGSKEKPYRMKITVGPHNILDRAVCGKRSGTALNC